jgi:hypothetical protein
MFTYTQIQEKINTLKWSKDSVEILMPILPRLGKWSLAFTWKQVNMTGAELKIQKLADILKVEPEWYTELERGNASTIYNYVQNILSSDNEFESLAVLSIILDIRSNKVLAELVPEQLSELFDKLEVKYLTNLPPFELANILNSRIASIVNSMDLIMEVKRYCYYKNCLDSDEVEVIKFRQALENNIQVVGSEQKSVKDWIKDFLQSATLSKDRSAYNVAYYMTNSPLAQKQNDLDKHFISDILQTYNWLFQPVTTDEEIESYEAHRLSIKPTEKSTSEVNSGRLKSFQPAPLPDQPIIHLATEQPAQQPTPPVSPVHLAPPIPVMRTIDEVIRANPKPTPPPLSKAGVVKDPTNIKMDEEQQRLERSRLNKMKSIQEKLAELKARNQKQ